MPFLEQKSQRAASQVGNCAPHHLGGENAARHTAESTREEEQDSWREGMDCPDSVNSAVSVDLVFGRFYKNA